jgi:hypothetical protein
MDEIIIFASILTGIITVILAFIAYRLQINMKKSQYNEEKMRVELNIIREKLEKQLYDINQRLTSDNSQWKDIFHILLSSQKDIDKQIEKKTSPKLSKFLIDMGLTEKDMKIDEDLIFVLTPFNKAHREVFDVMQKLGGKYGLKTLRGDEKQVSGEIFPHLLKKIVQANLIIVDIDGRNPNVFYELGIAHALDKPIILISKSIENVPFDIKQRSIIIYNDSSDLEKKLKDAFIKLSLSKDN